MYTVYYIWNNRAVRLQSFSSKDEMWEWYESDECYDFCDSMFGPSWGGLMLKDPNGTTIPQFEDDQHTEEIADAANH